MSHWNPDHHTPGLPEWAATVRTMLSPDDPLWPRSVAAADEINKRMAALDLRSRGHLADLLREYPDAEILGLMCETD